jgi:O-antigen biosynthesis protein
MTIDRSTVRGWLNRVRARFGHDYRAYGANGSRPSPAPDSLRCNIEAAYTADGRHVLVTGWAEDICKAQLFFHDEPYGQSTRLDPVLIPRDDVAGHLTTVGRPATTNMHGFTAVLQRQTVGTNVRLSVDDGNGWSKISSGFQFEASQVSLRELLGMALKAARQGGGDVARDFSRLARAMVTDVPPAPAVASVRTFGPPDGVATRPPRISIVIPFYGDGFYLLDHLIAQRRAPDDVEWIVVCDDPRLAETLTQTIVHRQSMIRQPTSIVYLGVNGGFAHANNIGASHARGKYVLLMNSDVYCRDFSFIRSACDLMEQDAGIGCVGFTLRFEDGTIQHDGMSFTRAPWFDNLWASDHLGKGMAYNCAAASHVEVDAVTAALMLLRRDDFADSRIFDPGYVIGDFEDADLCLRLREQGKAILLVRSGGIYHLERQSVRTMADDESRRAITLLNCLRFNARWGPALEQRAQSAKSAT